MNATRNRMLAAICVCLPTLWAAPLSADPLTGETLKFQQLPLNNGQAPYQSGVPYSGRDELSTAYFDPTFGGWRGNYVADDFGDLVSTPVVHVRWWGSYINGAQFNGVQKFMISFESDVPAAAGVPSHPGTPLLSQIVTLGALSPASGTFTQTLLNGNVPENIYQYNAELNLGEAFQEQANSVYWLKIVALVDPTTEGTIQWGWHNRDWSVQDTYASTIAPSSPGENQVGTVVNSAGTSVPVWHFQDDAVDGPVNIQSNAAFPGGLFVNQFNVWNSEFYKDSIDGPASPNGISQYSQDMAFELYTPITTPEPGSMTLTATGLIGLATYGWRRRRSVSVRRTTAIEAA